MAEKKNLLTREGLRKLEDELQDLKVNRRQEIAQKIKEAREQGDLSENAEYDAAKDEQRDIEARIEEIEKILKYAEVADEEEVEQGVVNFGSEVSILDIDMDEVNTFKIVGSTESNILEGKLSNESPLGMAILKKRVGETVTVEAPDGRRIMIGWMQNWDTLAHRCNDSKWFAQMSLPRELSVKNGRLYQTPIKELDALRKNRVEYNDVVIDNDTITLDRVEGRTIDMELVIRPEDKENVYKKFALRFAQNEKFHTELSFRPYESVLKIDRKFSGTERALVHQRRCLVNGDANELKLRVILDRFSAEVFINDGEQVMSVVMFTEQEANGISFFADGAAKIDVVKYDLV